MLERAGKSGCRLGRVALFDASLRRRPGARAGPRAVGTAGRLLTRETLVLGHEAMKNFMGGDVAEIEGSATL